MSSSAVSAPARNPARAITAAANPLFATASALAGATSATRRLRSGIESQVNPPSQQETLTRGQRGEGTFRSSDIAAFESLGSTLAGRRGLDVREAAPTAGLGGDISAVDGQSRVDRLVSLFRGRQSEIQQRRLAPGRSLLTSGRRGVLA